MSIIIMLIDAADGLYCGWEPALVRGQWPVQMGDNELITSVCEFIIC